MSDDLEKYRFYLDASFEYYGAVLFASIVRKPSLSTVEKNIQKLGKFETERFYNHFHMSALSDEIGRQKDYAFNLMISWRNFFNRSMPKREIVIEICDYGPEIIMYVYTAPA